jgi:hypothetical protein
LERLGAVLVAMGFAGNVVLSQLAVVVVIAHIGLKAFCEDYGGIDWIIHRGEKFDDILLCLKARRFL